MKKWLIVIGISVLGFNTLSIFAGSCTASATDCNAFCFATAPPTGDICCHQYSTFVICQSFDPDGNLVNEIELYCANEPGDLPGYGTGGSAGDCDTINNGWFHCDPFAY